MTIYYFYQKGILGNLKCSLIRIEYSVAIWIGCTHSTLNIQCKSRQVRLIRIECSVAILTRWAYSDSIFNAGLDRLG